MKRNLVIRKNVKGDGNCQFRAVLNQIGYTNDDEHYVELRKRACGWLRNNKRFVLKGGQIISDCVDGDWFKYVKKMEKDAVWGTEITLIALANVLNITIEVIHTLHEGVLTYAPSVGVGVKKIYLFNYNNIHYVSLEPKVKSLREERATIREKRKLDEIVDILDGEEENQKKKKKF